MGKKDDSHSARANSGKSLIESVLAPGERNIDSDSVLMWAVRSVRFLGCPADFLTGAGVLGSEELAPGVMVLGIALRLSGACADEAFGISDSDSDSSKIITICAQRLRWVKADNNKDTDYRHLLRSSECFHGQ